MTDMYILQCLRFLRWETTLDPERRVLKKVEIEDARLASEVTELLMGSDVAPRRNFIHEHAREAVIDA